jgi:hypothetical protein
VPDRCRSAGVVRRRPEHDLGFDHRDYGPDGEPRVVHVDQEVDYRITVLAPDFVTFIQSLRSESDYDYD